MFKQKNLFKTIAVSGLTVFLSVLIIYSIVRAGSLTPSGADVDNGVPTSTSYTLTDIYNRLNTNATAIAGNHSFTAPVGTPTSTLYTLAQIYNKIPTINPANLLSSTTYLGITGNIQTRTLSAATTTINSGYYAATTLNGIDADLAAGNIMTGVNIFGIAGSYGGGGYTYGSDNSYFVLTSAGAGAGSWLAANLTADKVATSTVFGTSSVGTLLGHLFNGTGQSITGGSQASGGVDDYNNGGAAPADTYSKGWTRCTSGNSYCGTNDTFAAYKDDSTGLIWSAPCKGNGCISYSTSSPTTYHWDNRGTTNYNATSSASSTASELCSNNLTLAPNSKSYHGSGWSLPHQKQLMMAYINNAHGNLESISVNRGYWSATTKSSDTTNAWYIYLSTGGNTSVVKTFTVNIICVRSN
jgi:hypothetical protein